jgi:N-acetylglucosaminyl-diphospho-decaprenol L-rhamnosyltransferase
MIQQNLTILIILYQENINIIRKCLDQLKNFKIILIDNANDKMLKKQIIQNYKIYKYFLNKKNIGFAKAANQGILNCDTEYMLLLGADCLTTFNDIKRLMLAKKEYKDCIFVSPTFYNLEGEYEYNGGPLYENGAKNIVLKNFGDVCVDTILTTAVLFRVIDLKNLGLFDENFFLYFLDDDICRRIKQLKKSIIQVFKSKAIHTHGQLKIKNKIKKIFFRNYYYDYEELYYLFKENIHKEKYLKIKKKIPKFIFKIFVNLFFLRFEKATYYLAKTLAFNKFRKFLK